MEGERRRVFEGIETDFVNLILPYERHRTQNGELQLPIAAPPISWGVDNEDMNAYNMPKRANCLKTGVVDVGPPTNWVKINVPETIRVQSDLLGRLVITGQPNQLDNLWGVTAFKKVVTLPAIIDQLRTNTVVTLHGCLHVHVPFAQQNL
ncbi:hypothetical protein KY285_010564 [Solanum tuberosum]|nr:hypothetical protein KY289_011109 [Solanum tuberosum]KAH0734857.1 hypothetical protein KY285_010564 [Solanum tuberosum]